MKYLFLIGIVSMITLAGCSSKPYTAKQVILQNYPAGDSQVKVCILSYGSEFKMKLIDALAAGLNSRDISVTVDSISNAGKYSPADYDAVVLLSSIEKFGPLKPAPEYIIANNYSPKIVYVSMYTLFAAPYGEGLDQSKIDAITSASSDDEAVLKDTEKAVVSKVMKVLGIAE
ncbi:MAG: hypothetical protein A2014_08250 [Spirochaetes bacterium GWF1_49_6]|jgi:flavodoxin|nr:MAG: hypothetical protein A2014_08250 [Spirochaetes bacterium GWF1_49_6]